MRPIVPKAGRGLSISIERNTLAMTELTVARLTSAILRLFEIKVICLLFLTQYRYAVKTFLNHS